MRNQRLPEMAVRQEVELSFGIIDDHIEPSQEVIAQQSTHKRIRDNIVLIFIQVGGHIPEPVISYLHHFHHC